MNPGMLSLPPAQYQRDRFSVWPMVSTFLSASIPVTHTLRLDQNIVNFCLLSSFCLRWATCCSFCPAFWGLGRTFCLSPCVFSFSFLSLYCRFLRGKPMSFAFPLHRLFTTWLDYSVRLLLASRTVFSLIQSEKLCCYFKNFKIFPGWKQVIIGAACIAFGPRM